MAFTLFPQLPTELRVAIWRRCLPRRIFELDSSLDMAGVEAREMLCQHDTLITHKNTRLPRLASVSREARGAALENWQQLPQSSPHTWYFWRLVRDADLWFDSRCVEAVHLNWSWAVDAEFGAVGNPMRYLGWAAGLMARKRASLMLEFLYEHSAKEDHSRDQFTLADVGDVMRRPDATFVVLSRIFVHADEGTAADSGLFGLLGDAPGQIVPIDDAKRLTRYMELQALDNVRFDYLFPNESMEQGIEGDKSWLDDALAKLFPDADTRAQLRYEPAIMFRLCSEGCPPTT